MTSKRFKPEIEESLRKSGWFPGRSVPDLVNQWRKDFKKYDDMFLFGRAEEVLLEFGGLNIKSILPGIDFLPEALKIDPTMALGEPDTWDYFEQEIGAKIFPLGELESGMAFIAIDDKGRVYHVLHFIVLIGNSLMKPSKTICRENGL